MPDSTPSTTSRSAEHSVRADLTRSLATQEGPYFGEFGGRFVPEALIAALDELETEYRKALDDPAFVGELARLQREYTGRPSPLTEVPRFARHAGGSRVFL